MSRSRLVLTVASALALIGSLALRPARAIDPTHLPTPQLEARYLALTHEFRCPVCQSESLADSDAEVAGEIRAQIRRMLLAGDSDRQIREFLVSRYTQFILLKPEYSLRNAWLWLAPVILLIIGVIIAARIIRARSGLVGQDVEPVDDDLILDSHTSPCAKSATPR
jgi:cytochrome c-type biogenesis protein CcmH